jgi:hypothetical protein
MSETVLEIITLSWGSPIGLGIFFMGVGVLWFVTVYKEINEKKE